MIKRILLTVVLADLCVTVGHAAMTGKAIMEQQIERHEADAEQTIEIMLLEDKHGNREKRVLKHYAKEMGDGLSRILIVFTSPAEINGTTLLTWEKNVGDNDQWLYLPASGKLKRIAACSKKCYFMGTDFTYEDMDPEDIDNFSYKILGTERLKYTGAKKKKVEAKCWIIEAVPANKSTRQSSCYAKRIMWVDQSNFFTLKIEFYSKTDEHIKTQYNQNIFRVKGKMWRANKSLMNNHDRRHKTLVGVKKRRINEPTDDTMFTENYIVTERHIQ